MEKETKLRFLEIVKEPIALSTFPSYFQTLIRIRELFSDEQASVVDIAKVIQIEPLTTIRLLQIANSAAYSKGRIIHTVHEAIVVLGLNLVKRIVLAVSLSQLIQARSVLIHTEITRIVWLNTLYTAAAGSVLGEEIGISEDKIIFRASFINLGVFYLIYRVSLDKDICLSVEDLKPFIYDYYSEITMKVLDYFDISSLIYRTFKTYLDDHYPYIASAASVPEIIYNAYLLARGKFDWFHELNGNDKPNIEPRLITAIEAKYQELRSMFD